MIELKDLKIGYLSGRKVKRVVSEGINATLDRGELVLLIGPNGSGKSTLIKTLCGFQKPVSGNVSIEGQDSSNLNEKSISSLISVVKSNAPTIENFTVRDVVAFGRYPYSGMFGSLKDSDYKIVDEAIDIIGIGKISNSMFNMISDGEKQKTMIAKSLAQQTPYVVMDEPMAFLDYQSRIEMMELLFDMIQKQNKGVLLSTHNLEMAIHTAEKLWIFDKESRFFSVTPQQLFEDELITRLFDKKTAEYLKAINKK